MMFNITIMTQIFAADNYELNRDLVSGYGIEGLSGESVLKLREANITADLLIDIYRSGALHVLLSTTFPPNEFATIENALLAYHQNATLPDKTNDTSRHAAPKLPKYVKKKLDERRIQLSRLREMGLDGLATLNEYLSLRDIAHISHALFNMPLPAEYDKKEVVNKILAVRKHHDVFQMRHVVKAVLTQFKDKRHGNVHLYDTFCQQNIENILSVARSVGFGQANYTAEAAAAEEGKRSEFFQVLKRFMIHYSPEMVQTAHGSSAEEGNLWIKKVVRQAKNDPKVFELIAYTISIIEELKVLEGEPFFDNLKYIMLLTIIENHKKEGNAPAGGCLEGVRNRAIISLAQLLDYILNNLECVSDF